MSEPNPNVGHQAGRHQRKQGFWRTYDGTDGLPNSVWCIHQDRQGYLWLGTNAGLYRYNGENFMIYTVEDGLPHDSIQAICEDQEGRLWLATGSFVQVGSGVSCYDGKRFVTYTTQDGLAHNHVLNIYCDSQDKLWFATLRGLSMFDGHRFESCVPDDGPSVLSSICEDQQGRLWFATNLPVGPSGHGVLCYDGGRFTRFTTEDGLPSNNIRTICMDNQGRLWFGDRESLCVYHEGQFTSYPMHGNPLGNGATALHTDRQGRLWLGATTRGITCVGSDATDSSLADASLTVYTIEEGSLSHALFDIMDDRDGNIWLARYVHGLGCLSPETIQVLTSEPVVAGILYQDRDGRIWFGNGADLFCIEDEVRHVKTLRNVHALLHDSVGCFWIAAGTGLFRYPSVDALWTDTPVSLEGFTDVAIGSILESCDGTIWLGGSGANLYHFEGDRFSTLSTPCKGFITALHQDCQERLWFGSYYGGGLCCYDGGQIKAYTVTDRLPDDHILSVLEDDAGYLWIGTLLGLCCFDGEQFIRQDDVRGWVFHPAKDHRGQLWFSTNSEGAYRYDGNHFQQLTTADGLPSNDVEGFLPQADGSVIIGTSHGIVRYRLTAVTPPAIEIQEVLADISYVNPTELELTTTAADMVTISYQGLSLSTQKMRYSYRLEGYDQDWTDTWESSVRYEALPVGEYRFSVLAINRDLVESEHPANLELTIVPDPRDAQIAQLESELERRNRELEAELADARDMQMRLLPEHAPMVQGAQIAGKCVTANTVGGDFFDYLAGDDHCVGLVVADVSGKAMRGAMNAVMADGIVSAVLEEADKWSPGSLMTSVNQVLTARMESDMNVTMLIGLLDTQSMTLTLANAAHHAYPLLVRHGQMIPLKSRGLPLGMRAGVEYREETFPLQSGDILVLMTDGIIEAHDSQGNMYGESGRLEQMLTGFTADMTAEAMVDALIHDAIDYAGGERGDDMTVLVAKIV